MAQSLLAEGYDIVIVKNDSTRVWNTVSDIDRVIFCETGTVTDIDGNVYKTVKIDDLWWMAENLKTTKYRDETVIPNVTVNATWAGLSTGAYCYYDNDSDNAETYGALYNWNAVNDARGLAPEGWRVASDDDWKALEMHLGMSQTDADLTGDRGTEGEKLKSTSGWNSSGNGIDEVGFAALPGGYRVYSSGAFVSMGAHAFFWTASETGPSYAWRRELYYDSVAVTRYSSFHKGHGFSVRCVKNVAP